MFFCVWVRVKIYIYIFYYSSLEGEDGKPYEYTAPNQSPINPPYKIACQLQRENLLDKSSIVGTELASKPPHPANSSVSNTA